MRKLVCIFASIIFSLQLFGDCIANVEAHIRAPRQFFHKLVEIMQAVNPDPKFQLQASFALMPFGYPNFNGISQTENALICVYNIDTNTPVIIASLKISDNATPVIEQSLQGICKFKRKDGYLFIAYNANSNTQEYIEATEKLISDRKISSLAKIKLDRTATKLLLKNNTNIFLNDIKSTTLKINKDSTQINLSIDMQFERNSPTEKIVNTVRRLPFAKETAYIPQDSEISVISKVKLPQDFPDFRKEIIDSLFAQTDADKLKDMYLKNDGTFTMAINLGNNLQITSVGTTAMTQSELLEFAKENPRIKYNTNAIEVINKIGKSDDVDFMESYMTLSPNQKTYSAVVNKYAVCTTNLKSLKDVANKIKSSTDEKNFPLYKYASDNSDVVVILNNKSIIDSLLSNIGAKIKKDVQLENTVISADIGLSKIRISTLIELQILKYYYSIYKSAK